MNKSWLRPVEQIILSARAHQARVLAFTGADNYCNVEAICEEVAEALAESDIKTLLIRLAKAAKSSENAPAWAPGSPATLSAITKHPKGFDQLQLVTSQSSRFLFNNFDKLKSCLDEDLKGYGNIIIELAGVLDDSAAAVNPLSVASECDAVYLVCRTGRTTSARVGDIARALKASGSQITGTILADADLKPLTAA
jgi:hypothetical protein